MPLASTEIEISLPFTLQALGDSLDGCQSYYMSPTLYPEKFASRKFRYYPR